MHPRVTSALLATAQQDILRDAERSRSRAAARRAAASADRPAAGRSAPPGATSPLSRMLCWLRGAWRRHVDLASPWGPISASGPCDA